MTNYKIVFKGGPGSGHFGHKGRKGQQGGSLPADAAASSDYNPAPDSDEYAQSRASRLEDDSEMGNLAAGMLADENSRKYPGLDPYSIDLIKTSKAAEDAGIKSYTDPRIVKDIARGAAELINGRTKVGYTVYGSDSPHLSADGQNSLGSFPMVAYGAEKPSQVKGMIEYLKGFGYKAILGPEKYGILVAPMNATLVEDYWARQKEYKIVFKGGPGSGHFGHKGRKGQQGGSLPKDGATSASDESSEMMDPNEIVSEARSSIKLLSRNLGNWAARDSIMLLANKYIGTDYMSLGGKEGKITAGRLAQQLLSLSNKDILDMYENDYSTVMHGNMFR